MLRPRSARSLCSAAFAQTQTHHAIFVLEFAQIVFSLRVLELSLHLLLLYSSKRVKPFPTPPARIQRLTWSTERMTRPPFGGLIPTIGRLRASAIWFQVRGEEDSDAFPWLVVLVAPSIPLLCFPPLGSWGYLSIQSSDCRHGWYSMHLRGLPLVLKDAASGFLLGMKDGPHEPVTGQSTSRSCVAVL